MIGKQRETKAKTLVLGDDWYPSFPNFLKIFQNARAAFFILDSEHEIRFWNRGAELLFEYKSEEIIGQNIENFFQTDLSFEQSFSNLFMLKSLAEELPSSKILNVTGLKKNKSELVLEISLNNVKNGNEDFLLVFVKEIKNDRVNKVPVLKNPELNLGIHVQLEYRIRFENLITTISTHFINLSSDKINCGIHFALKSIGEFAEVDRSYIFLFTSDKKTVNNTHEWCSPGVESQSDNLQGLSVSEYPWFMQQIDRLQIVYVPKVSDLPVEAFAEKEEFVREGIESLIIVPMVHQGVLQGYLGFDSVKREKQWTKDIIGLLQIVGEIFVNALERKKNDQALSYAKAKYLNIFENAVEGIYQSNPAGKFLELNPAMARIFGFTNAREMSELIQNVGLELYVEPGRRKEFLQLLLEKGRVSEFESQVKNKLGNTFWISENARAVYEENGNLSYCEGTVMDVTERKHMEAKLLFSAMHDALTGLPNRNRLVELLNRALARNQLKPGSLCVILMLDLDRFKMVNDSMGHLYGDRMLIAFARRLENCLPDGTILSRLGGDEFCILAEEIANSNQVTVLAEQIQEVLSQPFELDGLEIYAAASMGIAIGNSQIVANTDLSVLDSPTSILFRESGAEELLRDADTALHRAKIAGKGRYEVFDVSMHTRAVQLLTLETDMRRALERAEFCLHYQPIVSLNDQSLMGFEALIRWMHPRLGMVSPLDFIPLAEDTGLIIPIGRWVLWESCKQLHHWQSIYTGDKKLTVSVNLSGKQLQDLDLVRQIEAIIHETKIEAACLKLEVTESAIMENPEKAATILNQLKDLGIHLSLDDFGTGYSSLSYLHRFPFHNLKIDRSFVSKMEAGQKDSEIVKTINALAENLGMEVVAEGIETVEQWGLLHQLKCAYGQGYYFSRPLEVSKATVLVAKGGFPAMGPLGKPELV